MYKIIKPHTTSIEINNSYEGETIEKKIQRIGENEPITDGATLIYTERKDGVQPDYDPRTDRFEVAVEAMDYVTRSKIAKRAELGKKAIEGMRAEEGGGNPPPAEGTK